MRLTEREREREGRRTKTRARESMEEGEREKERVCFNLHSRIMRANPVLWEFAHLLHNVALSPPPHRARTQRGSRGWRAFQFTNVSVVNSAHSVFLIVPLTELPSRILLSPLSVAVIFPQIYSSFEVLCL